jgi:predicted glycoside hydrolase/deacetylase ChbG (UPF0249 family)
MNQCDYCHKFGATIEFMGSHYHKKCYATIAGILAKELAKANTE